MTRDKTAPEHLRYLKWRCLKCSRSGELSLLHEDDCETTWRRVLREHDGSGCQFANGEGIAVTNDPARLPQ